MNERIKKLRKVLDLTQQEFGERLGIKRNTIATYESGRNEPIDAVVSLICKEFNVNEEWLRDGTGEMFKAAPSTALDALAEEYNYSHRDYVIVEKFSNLSRKDRDVILNFITEVAAGCYDVSEDTPAISEGPAEIDIDSAVEAYRHTLELQKKAAAESSASNGIGKTEGNEKGA